MTDTKLSPRVVGSMPRSISASRVSFSRTRTRIRFTIICGRQRYDCDDVLHESKAGSVQFLFHVSPREKTVVPQPGH